MMKNFSCQVRGLMALVSLVACSSVGAEETSGDILPAMPPKPPAQIEDVTIFTVEQRIAASKLTTRRNASQREKAKFQAEVRGAFEEERFEDLNRLASEAISSGKIFGDGAWGIYVFHQTLIPAPEVKEEGLVDLESRFLRWIQQTPESLTARVALVEFYIGYAWRARGGGYANTVSAEQWKVFRERLAMAEKVLLDATKVQGQDPYWYAVLASLGRAQQWPADKYELMFQDGLRNYPTNWELACTRAYGLLPRWYGEPGDWEAFAEKETQREGGLGPEVYARIVLSLFGYYDNVFKDTKASWERTREGLEILRKKYPDDDVTMNNAVLLARMAGDKEMARALLAQMGDNYHSGIFRSREDVILMREWAQSP